MGLVPFVEDSSHQNASGNIAESRGLEQGENLPLNTQKRRLFLKSVNLLGDISEEFMRTIFGMEPGDYLITDESSLSDFVGMDEADLEQIHRKIQETFDIDVSDGEAGNLAAIFMKIHRAK